MVSWGICDEILGEIIFHGDNKGIFNESLSSTGNLNSFNNK